MILFLFVCFQMDSEGEEQILKTYHSSTGEWAFFWWWMAERSVIST